MNLGPAKQVVDRLESVVYSAPPQTPVNAPAEAVLPRFEAHSWFAGYNLPASKEAEICALIMSGRRIQAIAALRDNTRLGLADAKLQVERVALLMGAPRTANAGCYIATACYGDYVHPDVLTLRRFRDERLSRSAPGRLGIRIYYAVSPALARHLGRNTRLASLVRRRVLEPVVVRLRGGVERGVG